MTSGTDPQPQASSVPSEGPAVTNLDEHSDIMLLKQRVQQNLIKKGLISKLKAELRAAVYDELSGDSGVRVTKNELIDSEKVINLNLRNRLGKKTNSSEQSDIKFTLDLVRELLEYYQLSGALQAFDDETSNFYGETRKSARDELEKNTVFSSESLVDSGKDEPLIKILVSSHVSALEKLSAQKKLHHETQLRIENLSTLSLNDQILDGSKTPQTVNTVNSEYQQYMTPIEQSSPSMQMFHDAPSIGGDDDGESFYSQDTTEALIDTTTEPTSIYEKSAYSETKQNYPPKNTEESRFDSELESAKEPSRSDEINRPEDGMRSPSPQNMLFYSNLNASKAINDESFDFEPSMNNSSDFLLAERKSLELELNEIPEDLPDFKPDIMIQDTEYDIDQV